MGERPRVRGRTEATRQGEDAREHGINTLCYLECVCGGAVAAAGV